MVDGINRSQSIGGGDADGEAVKQRRVQVSSLADRARAPCVGVGSERHELAQDVLGGLQEDEQRAEWTGTRAGTGAGTGAGLRVTVTGAAPQWQWQWQRQRRGDEQSQPRWKLSPAAPAQNRPARRSSEDRFPDPTPAWQRSEDVQTSTPALLLLLLLLPSVDTTTRQMIHRSAFVSPAQNAASEVQIAAHGPGRCEIFRILFRAEPPHQLPSCPS
ncbi:uncharacterized protein MYCFIDRAFT_173546 [Pseudocercospora fijiensis CIRAD86]|uniref:Uncharacterized protein n=1 Tax=Pseudocercospora fijiensis (strain CIRAD86) TaxID=383855 RepID=M2Z438_PSEFD|nr:uncharacterized protein MYCFIDRAFT_173546 [Pseudocercospora fijiensis CIRAD86]EME84585.1 hypothetical protein MYCFIDRAFT_173546 [Pseudocercospora fijiensis CIRAD86]